MIYFHKKPIFIFVKIGTLLRKIYSFIDRMRWNAYYSSIIHNFKSFGDSVAIDYGVIFYGPERISIGNNVFIGKNVLINAAKGGAITIDDEVAIGDNTTLITWNYGNFNNRSLIRSVSKKDIILKNITIGAGVEIGYNVTINPGIILGEGCIIAAGSVVTRNVKPFTIMAGSPAVTVGMRKK